VETTVARTVLAARGLRATPQRLAVLTELMRERGDITAQALHERLREGGAAMGLATVYRTLSALVEQGVIDTLTHGPQLCYRFCSPEHHHHLTCRVCHRVVEILECGFGDWAEAVGRQHGFVDVSHTVELLGRCGNCREAAD
jgi:Fur family transcriptional regulator, ferric uptake regulator